MLYSVVASIFLHYIRVSYTERRLLYSLEVREFSNYA